ncbi:LLM class flavin-dependent oxidoreductase [Labedaea rhizosphaerae]|uniref:Luciferase-like monooxygenase n=1 Tax=Labedaea rhizosphaerae TaxID=598644 RepID=A0A4R6SLZ4_LABRH|nr:LLM class flavin-dependent oxidoreductase [Labedaea rhizosphaerae]TDQ04997.1 luciferase-like monooxygenase [Labedaea rhizosphaerae]
MRVGIVILPEHRWWAAEPKWQAVESYGFDHAWTMDHLGWRSLVDGPWFGAVPTLTAAAMVTERINLGTFVASPNFRHPVPFARELTALDDISDGRFILGVGAGGATGYDNTVMGSPELTAGQRAARFGEFVEVLDQLLTLDRTTFHGEYYTVDEARSAPGCVQRPRLPFVVAANGAKTMKIAARFGTGWATTGGAWGADVTMDDWWRSVGEASEKFTDALIEVGQPRRPARFLQLDAAPEYPLASVEAFRDALGRAAEHGFTDVVAPWPRDDGIFAGAEQVLEDIAADVLPELAGR